MTLHVETADRSADLEAQINATVRDVAKLRADVQLLAPGGIGDGEKIIEDRRTYR